VSTEDPAQTEVAPGSAEEEAEGGPHLWLNWQGEQVGQPARESSDGSTSQVHPLWEERSLYSDAPIAGELEFGPFSLHMTLSGGGQVGRPVQVLVFRHRDHLFERPPGQMREELDLAGWTGGDIGEQLAALLSLVLGRRVRSGGVTRQGFEPGDPLGRPLATSHHVPALIEPLRAPILPGIAAPSNVGDAAFLIERFGKLSGGDAAALTRAAGQYADAIWWADGDPRIAWIKLVGALEVAANRWDRAGVEEPVELLKRHRGRLYGRLKTIDMRAVEIVAEELAHTLNVERKLLAFSLRYLPGPPVHRPNIAQVDFENLEPALSQIYEWRSRDLHDGIPFPPPLCEPPITDGDVAMERFPALGIEGQGGYWPAEVLPMYLHVFAHIVGGALCNWWRDLPAPGPPDASR
jgi:hypothetical protein